MMNVKQFSDNRTPAAMKWGRDHENAARDSFENVHGLKVRHHIMSVDIFFYEGSTVYTG